MQMSIKRLAPSASVVPHALKKSLPPPKVPVPKLSTGTLNPDPPNCRYSIVNPLTSRRSEIPARTHEE
jgi:hypothetical protein